MENLGFSILHEINLMTVYFLLIISQPQKKTPHPPKYMYNEAKPIG